MSSCWRRADLVVDTTRLTPGQVADRIWDTARDRIGSHQNSPR
jgi:hypothetical protein